MWSSAALACRTGWNIECVQRRGRRAPTHCPHRSRRTKGLTSLQQPLCAESSMDQSVSALFFILLAFSFLNFSLSLNQGSLGHTSLTWTQFSTVERTHQVVLLSLRGWYFGTFYLLGASEASCPSINELQRDVTDRNTQWAHLFDWRLSQTLTSLFFPLTDSGALFGLNGAVMV